MNLGNDLSFVLLVIWPPYIANSVPVIVSRLPMRRRPIDGGRLFLDGRRIFGDNKTVEGFLLGCAVGTLLGYAIASPIITLLEAFVLSVGALTGDLIGAFVKRRMGLQPGERAIPLDQLDFIAFSMVLLSRMRELSCLVIVTALAITVPIHMATNYAAYRLGLKNVPY